MINEIKNKKINNRKKRLKNTKKSFTTGEVIFLILITCVVSLLMGWVISFNSSKNAEKQMSKELKQFINNYEYILNNYYDKIDKKELLNEALKGMLSSLDDQYSYYIDQESSDAFNLQLEGEYKGIGIEITETTAGEIIVNSVVKNSPSEKAGLKEKDVIKEIDGKIISNKNPSEIASYIKKSTQKTFSIKIERDSKELEFEVKKENIMINSITSKVYKENNKTIGYLAINIFSNTTYNQFKEELKKLENKKIDSLIIDVRNNSGGHLTTAVNIMSLFLNSKHLIYQTETKEKIEKYYSKGKETKKYPIVVLQNKNSASASEMLSATLKEEYGATIIGEVSYGKGTVQELKKLTDGTEYKITTKKWLTPKGNWVNKKGVTPDISILSNDKYKKNPVEKNDNQLKTALNYLKK